MKNTKKILTIVWAVVLLFVFNNARSQLIVNGSFENTTSIGCNYNLLNASFNALMPGCFAFGANEELDIQTGVCYGTAINGNSFVSLAVENGTLLQDAMTITLTQPLVAGNSYTLSFYLMANTQFGTNTIDSLEIGVSGATNAFGQKLGAFWCNNVSWTAATLMFIAPTNSNYISVQNQGAQYAWIFVDDFVLTDVTGINGIEEGSPSVIFNSNTGELVVKAENNLNSVTLMDVAGRTIFNRPALGFSFLSGHFTMNDGIYFVRVGFADGSVFIKKIFCE